jgi:hypothetical protein
LTKCIDRSVITLTKNADGTLGYNVRVADVAGSAALRKAAPTSSNVPIITNVTPVRPQARQNITIMGSGFGTQPAYNGDSPYLSIHNATRGWNAGWTIVGWTGDSPIDKVTLDIGSWTDSEITLRGLTGDYGKNGWFFNDGDIADILVWNPNTDAGSGACRVIVGNNPTKCRP